MLDLLKLPVGEYLSNCYYVGHGSGQAGVLIDPGGDQAAILEWLEDKLVSHILLTHGHMDHVGALQPVREALAIPVAIHRLDAERFGVDADLTLEDGDQIAVGEELLRVVHIPGHTPGSLAFRLPADGGAHAALVGDAIFPGGPGHTRSPEDLSLSLDSLARTVFTWPDETILHPGHGGETAVGAERAAFEAFVQAPRPADLCGDVLWRQADPS